MTNQEAFYIVGNIPIPTDDENYNICQYQDAKAIALDSIQKIDDIKSKVKSWFESATFIEEKEDIKLLLDIYEMVK